MSTSDPTYFGHVALAGAPNAGKSSLLNALVGQRLAIVSPRAQTTRLPVVGLRTEGRHQIAFHDLPGLLDPAYLLQARMLGAAMGVLSRSDLILHLHPAPDAPAPRFETIAGLDRPPAAPVVIVYTKGDLVGASRLQELEGKGGLVVSAATGAGVDRLVAHITQHLPPGEHQFDAEDVGTQPVRFFAGEYVREAAFALLQDEVPYAVTAEVEEFREAERPVYIRVNLYVERESQKRIVIGGGGRTIKAIGAQARAQIEALLGVPVYLDLWVKVLPHWRADAAALTRFGFPDSTHTEVS
ncbi:MAG TPA: GTPase Era [Gemmatimonadales bacterium]|jgi:GTP-binding protein Era